MLQVAPLERLPKRPATDQLEGLSKYFVAAVIWSQHVMVLHTGVFYVHVNRLASYDADSASGLTTNKN